MKSPSEKKPAYTTKLPVDIHEVGHFGGHKSPGQVFKAEELRSITSRDCADLPQFIAPFRAEVTSQHVWSFRPLTLCGAPRFAPTQPAPG